MCILTSEVQLSHVIILINCILTLYILSADALEHVLGELAPNISDQL